jgi:hypothetical protein
LAASQSGSFLKASKLFLAASWLSRAKR